MATMRGPLMASSCADYASISSSSCGVSRECRSGREEWHVSTCAPACVVPRGSTFRAEMGLLGVSAGLRLKGKGTLLSGLRHSHFLPRLPQGSGEGIGLPLGMGKSRRSSSAVVQAKNSGIEAPERILAALGYILPFFDGIQYGRYFFMQYPVAENLLRPLYPLLAAYKGFPYSNFIAFFSLYLLVVRNQSVSRYVRFNAMQAVVLDVLLIFPTLVERTFAPRGGFGFELLIIFYNTVFLFLVSCFLFGVGSCILGKTPRLPIVADAADAQV